MKVLNFQGRDIVLTELSGVKQPFYRLGRTGGWYPFLDIYFSSGLPTWGLCTYLDYDLDGNPTPLHRYGTHLNRGVSRMLEILNIPVGQQVTLEEVQRFIR
jgi:hypothetical protein